MPGNKRTSTTKPQMVEKSAAVLHSKGTTAKPVITPKSGPKNNKSVSSAPSKGTEKVAEANPSISQKELTLATTPPVSKTLTKPTPASDSKPAGGSPTKKAKKAPFDFSGYDRQPKFASGKLDMEGNSMNPTENGKTGKILTTRKSELFQCVGTVTSQILVRCQNRNNPELPGWLYPFFKMLREEDTLRKQLKVHHIFDLRTPDDPNVHWSHMKTKRNGETFVEYWPILIRDVKDPKDNISDNRIRWTKQLVCCVNQVAEKTFLHKSHFAFGSDLTPDNDDLVYLGDYLTTNDVMKVIQLSHENMTFEQILADDTLLGGYYGPDRLQQVRNWFGGIPSETQDGTTNPMNSTETPAEQVLKNVLTFSDFEEEKA